MESAPQTPRPSWFVRFVMATVRILFVTLLFTLLGMAVGLFFGIIVTAFRHHPMNEAYRVFAVPVAVAWGAGALVWSLVQTARRASSHKS